MFNNELEELHDKVVNMMEEFDGAEFDPDDVKHVKNPRTNPLSDLANKVRSISTPYYMKYKIKHDLEIFLTSLQIGLQNDIISDDCYIDINIWDQFFQWDKHNLYNFMLGMICDTVEDIAKHINFLIQTHNVVIREGGEVKYNHTMKHIRCLKSNVASELLCYRDHNKAYFDLGQNPFNWKIIDPCTHENCKEETFAGDLIHCSHFHNYEHVVNMCNKMLMFKRYIRQYRPSDVDIHYHQFF